MRKKMKSALLVAVLCGFSTNSYSFGVPVIDLTAISTEIENQIETMLQWGQQYEQMVAEIAQLKATYDEVKATYDAVTGIRNFGDVLNNPLLSNYIPEGFNDVYNGINQGGFEGMTTAAEGILDAAKVFDRCKGEEGQSKIMCEAQMAKPAQDLAFLEEAYEKTNTRFDQITALMQEINTTTDPKGIAELQGRIGLEQAQIDNEMMRLQMFQMQAQAQTMMLREQEKQMLIMQGSNRKHITGADEAFSASLR